MKLKLQCYGCLCELKAFEINDIKADYMDFRTKEDTDTYNAPDYGCGNMQFIPKPVTQKVLDKYQITVDDYNKICEELDCLSFGYCGWCI